jgi:hypothetical protein
VALAGIDDELLAQVGGRPDPPRDPERAQGGRHLGRRGQCRRLPFLGSSSPEEAMKLHYDLWLLCGVSGLCRQLVIGTSLTVAGRWSARDFGQDNS